MKNASITLCIQIKGVTIRLHTRHDLILSRSTERSSNDIQ